MGRDLPPNSATNSSIMRCCAELRETKGSKTCALLIFSVRRTAFLNSRR